jgi:hypothetical protein
MQVQLSHVYRPGGQLSGIESHCSPVSRIPFPQTGVVFSTIGSGGVTVVDVVDSVVDGGNDMFELSNVVVVVGWGGNVIIVIIESFVAGGVIVFMIFVDVVVVGVAVVMLFIVFAIVTIILVAVAFTIALSNSIINRGVFVFILFYLFYLLFHISKLLL